VSLGHEDGEENDCFENVTTIGGNDAAAVTTLSKSFALKRNVRTNGVS
jgi:hypothetical protein